MRNKLYKRTEPQVKRVNYQSCGELRVVSLIMLCFYLVLQYNFSNVPPSSSVKTPCIFCAWWTSRRNAANRLIWRYSVICLKGVEWDGYFFL